MKAKMVTGFTKDTYVIETYDGKNWRPYNKGTRFSREAAIIAYTSLSKSGVMARVHNGYGTPMDMDELSGKKAAMRLTDEYQLGWEECWNWLKSNGGAW